MTKLKERMTEDRDSTVLHQKLCGGDRTTYINFILERSKITHRERCSTSGVWGSWSWLFSYHDGDSIYGKHCRTAPLHYEHAVRAGRYGRKLVVDFYTKPEFFVQMAR
ncbi:hypothetical protein Zmor_007995 [Zophobas morio]|uniref:Uncharacterized protein n=1 Tax=Zophobas morio TaxID=2755281 RepID=A0AA38IY30_9CUCU|nr:hypothetical protein Zmor_007995 [Zophobas morio]